MKTSSPMKKLSIIASGVALSTCVLAIDKAHAQIITLDFEGLQNLEEIREFYNGGTGSLGSSGTDYGISFSPNSLAIIDDDAGGTGNIGGLPSPVTVAFFLSGTADIMNVADGFDTGFSFFYSAVNNPGFVNVYDGLGGTGNLLATINLPLTPNGGSDPACNFNNFCPFVPIGVAFDGIAKSVDFGGVANQVAFDNITLGSENPCTDPEDCNQVPEPTSVMGLLAISALGAGSVLQRKLLK
jgi:hypothetical protein